MRRVMGNLLMLGLLVSTGCLPSQQPPASASFRASDTPSKVPAIVGAADNKDADTLSELVHALSHKDPAVRLFAAQSLRERTGMNFGYRYYASVDERRQAIDRWRTGLAEYLGPTNAPPPAEDKDE